MIADADKHVVGLLGRTNAAAAPDEKEGRERHVQGLLVDGADDAELARVEALLAEVKAGIKAPAPAPAAVEPTPVPPKRDQRLYSPKRSGFMRSTGEEGIRAELDAMNAEARGTPFYDAAPVERPAPSASKAPLVERLAKLTRKP